MKRVFKYFKKTGELCDSYGGWDGDDGYDFYYEPRECDLKSKLVNIIADYFGDFVDKKHWKEFLLKIEQLLNDSDMWEDMANVFEEDIKEAFEDEALESVE